MSAMIIEVLWAKTIHMPQSAVLLSYKLIKIKNTFLTLTFKVKIYRSQWLPLLYMTLCHVPIHIWQDITKYVTPNERSMIVYHKFQAELSIHFSHLPKNSSKKNNIMLPLTSIHVYRFSYCFQQITILLHLRVEKYRNPLVSEGESVSPTTKRSKISTNVVMTIERKFVKFYSTDWTC